MYIMLLLLMANDAVELIINGYLQLFIMRIRTELNTMKNKLSTKLVGEKTSC